MEWLVPMALLLPLRSAKGEKEAAEVLPIRIAMECASDDSGAGQRLTRAKHQRQHYIRDLFLVNIVMSNKIDEVVMVEKVVPGAWSLIIGINYSWYSPLCFYCDHI